MDLERLRRLTEADPERVAHQVRDQVREYIELNRRRFQPPPPDPRPAVIAFLGGLILGAIAMWLLDPDEGDTRRGRVAQMFRRIGETPEAATAMGTATPEVASRTGKPSATTPESATSGRPVFSEDRSRSSRATSSSTAADAAPTGLGVTGDRAPEASTAGAARTSTEPTEPAPASPSSERGETA
jgi:hypothetical protein